MRIRPFSWVILAINALFVIWVVSYLVNVSNDPVCDKEVELRDLCEAATGVGAGIGVGIIIAIWVVLDIILLVIWLITKPRGWDNPHPSYAQTHQTQSVARSARVGTSGNGAATGKRVLAIAAAVVVIGGGTMAGYLLGRDHGRDQVVFVVDTGANP